MTGSCSVYDPINLKNRQVIGNFFESVSILVSVTGL